MKKILIVATSLDGYIAESEKQVSTAWTSEEDKAWFNKLSREIGVMIMGKTTYETIGRPLPERKTIVMTRDENFAQKIENFEIESEEKLYATGTKSPQKILEVLEQKGLSQVAICGGAKVYQEFLVNELIDEIYLTIEPVFLGGEIKLWQGGERKQFKLIERIQLSSQTTVFHLSK